MSTVFNVTDTVGVVVARRASLSRVFEQAGIDYCCGGRKTLADVCREKNLEPAAFLERLEAAALATGEEPVGDAASMSLADLADHIERTHHVYLRAELPRLDWLARKVAAAHGARNPRLHEVRDIVLALAPDLSSHMIREERVLFPVVRLLEAGGEGPVVDGGVLTQPVQQMEQEHDHAGAALARLRELTDGFEPPAWACNTYRALLDALASLERDTHLHIHKENNVLFPRALELARRSGANA